MPVETRPQKIEPRTSTTPALLVDQYFMDVYGLCFRVLGHPHDAEDATQETFMALFRERDKIGRAESPRAWILTIARNTAVSLFRARRRANPLEEGLAEAPPIEEPADRGRLDAALAGLAEDDRHLLQMKFLESKSAQEMAAATGRNRGSLATALCRALQRLRSLYQGGPGR
jgi:RNA polymerase sigma factor (sigma-70 family)